MAVARLILGPDMNIQAPPNLAPSVLELLLRSGLNDWGGVSPVTIDFINPEAPWPQITELRDRTAELGFVLRPRLTIYPEYLEPGTEYVASGVMPRIREIADEDGYLRGGMERYGASLD